MKLKQDRFALIAGSLFAAAFVLSGVMFALEVLSPINEDLSGDVMLWLISAQPLFSLAGAIVCFFRLRGVPATVVCLLGAAGFFSMYAVFGYPFRYTSPTAFWLALIGCFLGGAGCIRLAFLGKRVLSPAVPSLRNRASAVLSAVGFTVGQATSFLFTWTVYAFYELFSGYYGQKALMVSIRLTLFFEYLIPSVLLVAAVLLFSLWLTKRSEQEPDRCARDGEQSENP